MKMLQQQFEEYQRDQQEQMLSSDFTVSFEANSSPEASPIMPPKEEKKVAQTSTPSKKPDLSMVHSNTPTKMEKIEYSQPVAESTAASLPPDAFESEIWQYI